MSGQTWRWPWEPLQPGTLTDDHGQPAFFGIYDFCGLPSLCMHGYTEAAGPCQLSDPEADGWGLVCRNCVCVIHLCVDREACAREAVTGRDDGGCEG